ncbi:MAG TPA: hypothetical protein EYG73_03720 [Arcobacter sp.]|nr:hypothetical protein [Arcobacter sp.]
MKNEDILKTLKDTYPRDIRKQISKNILQQEKVCNLIEMKEHYLIINQIMSYVLKELDWKLVQNSSSWDESPLTIMKEVFPKIEDTKWYKEQKVLISSSIDVVIN